MKINVVKAHSPEWADHEKSAITLMVTFDHLEHEVSFTAAANDDTEHGRELLVRAKFGEYGTIAPYSGPSVDEIALAEFKALKSKEMAATEAAIAPLERARRLGVATDEEVAELERLERYSVYLMRAKGPELIALSDM